MLKKLLLLFALSVSTCSLSSQIDYYVGMGPMSNNGKFDSKFVYYQPSLSYHVSGGIKYPINRLSFFLDGEWNFTPLIVEFWEFFSNHNITLNYLKIIPGIEFKPFNFIAFRMGGYGGIRVKEEVQQRSFTSSSNESKITKNWDYGLKGGADIYFSKRFSIGLFHTLGFYNIVHPSFTNGFGNLVAHNSKLSIRNTQLSFKFHFIE